MYGLFVKDILLWNDPCSLFCNPIHKPCALVRLYIENNDLVHIHLIWDQELVLVERLLPSQKQMLSRKCRAEEKKILFLFTDIVKFNIRKISLLASKNQNVSDTYNFWVHGGIFYCHNKLIVYQTKALAYIELMKFTMLIETVTSACKIGAIKGKSGHRHHTEVNRHL